MTALPTRLAPRNRPTGERSTPCISTPRFAPARSIARQAVRFNPAQCAKASTAEPGATRKSAKRLAVSAHFISRRSSARPAGVFNSLASIVPSLSVSARLKATSTKARYSSLLIVLSLSGSAIFQSCRGNAASQLLAVEGAVMVLFELVEQRACGGLRLIEIDRSILVGVEAVERRGRERGRSARHDDRRRKRDRQQGCKRQGFHNCQLHRDAPGDDHGTQ